jgi:hypothetical protein
MVEFGRLASGSWGACHRAPGTGLERSISGCRHLRVFDMARGLTKLLKLAMMSVHPPSPSTGLESTPKLSEPGMS